MPKVKLGLPDRESIFGDKLKGNIIGSGMKCKEIASAISLAPRTMSSRLKKPSDMSLGELKQIIKLTDMQPEPILDYLYDGKVKQE